MVKVSDWKLAGLRLDSINQRLLDYWVGDDDDDDDMMMIIAQCRGCSVKLKHTQSLIRHVDALHLVPWRIVQSLNSRFEILYASALFHMAKTHRYTHTHTSAPGCMFIMKCSMSIKFKLKIALPLQNQNITINSSKHTRHRKELFSFQILSTILSNI